jgi:hypothetical protein
VLAVVVWSRGVGSVHFLKAESNNSFQKVHTAYTSAPHNHSQHNQASSHEVLANLVLFSPDDGHNDARNMLRFI